MPTSTCNCLKGGPDPTHLWLVESSHKPEATCSTLAAAVPLPSPGTTCLDWLLSADFPLKTLTPLENNSSFPLLVSLLDLACPQVFPTVARWHSYSAVPDLTEGNR